MVLEPVPLIARGIAVTSTVSKYWSIKYQTCDPVSISKNWKPAGVMEGIGSTPSLKIKYQIIDPTTLHPQAL